MGTICELMERIVARGEGESTRKTKVYWEGRLSGRRASRDGTYGRGEPLSGKFAEGKANVRRLEQIRGMLQ